MAIAWMYREDYSRAGYLVLPMGELRDRFVVWQSFVASLALIPVSLIPMINGESGPLFISQVAARQLLATSIIYLPLVFILMMLDK